MPGSLLSAIGLSALGFGLAGLAAVVAGRLGREKRLAKWAPIAAASGLTLACLLPFGWVLVFGRL